MEPTHVVFMCCVFLVLQATALLTGATVSWFKHFGPRHHHWQH